MHPQTVQCALSLLVFAGVAAWVATRREHDATRRAVVALMIALATFSLAVVLRREVAGGEQSRLLYLLYYLAGVSLPPLWFAVARQLSRLGAGRAGGPRVALLFAPSALAFLAALTQPWHGSYLRIEGVPALHQRAISVGGPLCLIFTAWFYLLAAAGVALLFRSAARSLGSGAYGTGLLQVCAMLLPLVAGLSYSLGLLPIPYNPLPPAAAASIAALFALHWRHRLRETLPIARRDVIEHLTDGVLLMNRGGWILDVNPAAERITGRPASELRGQLAFSVFPTFVDGVDRRELERVAEGLELTGGPWLHRFRTREGLFVESSTAVVADHGRPAGIFVVLRDLTEDRRLERFLQQGQRLETAAGLAAGIAHEVNNPLAYVQANLCHLDELITDMGESPRPPDKRETGELREIVAECTDGVHRIRGIVDRMRRFSRLEDDELVPVDLNEVVRDALRIARMQESGPLEIDLRLAADLDPVQGSPEYLVQALLNLLVNARQALAGRKNPRVSVATESRNGVVEIRISDNGPGIPPEIQRRIFDPFFTTKEPGDGTGLGLAISFGIVREHHGELVLESEAGGGARFSVRIPTADPAPGAGR